MKKLLLFTILTLYASCLISQRCLPEGIHFYTQQDIDNFSINYPNCTKIEGRVSIADTIDGNIKNLLGLSNITSIGGYLSIVYNDSLSSLSGLENLDSVGYSLSIAGNNLLINLAEFEKLSYVFSFINIEENASLLTLQGLELLDTVTSIVIIENESLQDLSNLVNLKNVKGLLHIENNQLLSSMSGLDNLVFVGEDLKIFNNDLFTNLQGLNNLEYIRSGFKIRYNDQLSSLDGLENLDTINGGISIWDNSVLSSLESIANSYIGFSLSIYDNPLLEVCNINSICKFLSGNPQHVDIYNNSIGCNSIEEVEELCLVTLPENYDENLFRIYPNPTNNEIFVSNINTTQVDNVCIYNILNQKIKTEFIQENKIEISELDQGIYIIELLSNGLKYRYKFVKK